MRDILKIYLSLPGSLGCLGASLAEAQPRVWFPDRRRSESYIEEVFPEYYITRGKEEAAASGAGD